MNDSPFAFEVSTYRDDNEPVFKLQMRYQGRVIWSDETPVDFGAQNTDDPYEPSTPLTCDDLTWALRRAGWQKLGDWDTNPTDPGYLSAKIAPTDFAIPHVTLAPSLLARLS